MEITPFEGKIFVKGDQMDMGAFKAIDSRVITSGVVTHIGPNVTSVKVGDKVYFAAWGTDFAEINGEKYIILTEGRNNLQCIVK